MPRILIIFLLALWSQGSYGQIFSTADGNVEFLSDAPLEMIKASSDKLQGLLDLERKTFAFQLHVESFEGFNSPLQKIHFYENYMESDEFPLATFRGKIIEEIGTEKDTYRAKGNLEIHGVTVERIVQTSLHIVGDEVFFSSNFDIPLADHQIELPRIVHQKIAEHIFVRVNGKLVRRG